MPPDRVFWEAHGTLLTLVGENPIYELNSTIPSVVAQPGFTLPSTTIDTLCISSAGSGKLLGTTGFSEVRSYQVNGGYSLVALAGTKAEKLFQSNSTTTKLYNGTEITYLANGAGLHIQEQLPTSGDTTYFTSFIDASVSSSIDWSTVDKLACHLNSPSKVGGNTHTIFVTSTSSTANLGGIAGADGICANRAALGIKTRGLAGTWRAVLKSEVSAPQSRITFDFGNTLVNTQGQAILTTASSLWNYGVLQTPIAYDENGQTVTDPWTWTGATAFTTHRTSCNDWTDGVIQDPADVGDASKSSNQWWREITGTTCDDTHPIYCVNSKN